MPLPKCKVLFVLCICLSPGCATWPHASPIFLETVHTPQFIRLERVSGTCHPFSITVLNIPQLRWGRCRQHTCSSEERMYTVKLFHVPNTEERRRNQGAHPSSWQWAHPQFPRDIQYCPALHRKRADKAIWFPLRRNRNNMSRSWGSSSLALNEDFEMSYLVFDDGAKQ